MLGIPFIPNLSEGFTIYRGSAHNMHIIILHHEHCLYIVTPLVAAVLEGNREDNREDTSEVTIEVNMEDTREDTRENTREDTMECGLLIVTDEAVEGVMGSMVVLQTVFLLQLWAVLPLYVGQFILLKPLCSKYWRRDQLGPV